MNEKYLYAILLKPVATAGGPEALEPNKKLMFEGLLSLMAKFIEASQEVEKTHITPDFSILVVAKEDIYTQLLKLGDKVLVSKLDPSKYDFSSLEE
jgi:hypothetical protein